MPDYSTFRYQGSKVVAVYAPDTAGEEKRNLCLLENGSWALLNEEQTYWIECSTKADLEAHGWKDQMESVPIWTSPKLPERKEEMCTVCHRMKDMGMKCWWCNN